MNDTERQQFLDLKEDLSKRYFLLRAESLQIKRRLRALELLLSDHHPEQKDAAERTEVDLHD